MNYLRTHLHNKPLPVSLFPRKFGNPFRNNKSGRKALSFATNSVLDTVSGV